MKRHVISIVFLTGAVYDGLLGLLFLLGGPAVFRYADVTEPNHYAYVYFPASLLLVFTVMFFRIARRPLENRVLIPYAVMMKLCYSFVVFGFWMFGDIPYIWKPMAIYDLLFAAFFYAGYTSLARQIK